MSQTSDSHECVHPESKDGGWTTIGRCPECNELPSVDYIMARQKELRAEARRPRHGW